DRLAFWQHGLGSAVCAQVLAKALGRDQALAFTAGLLHDIGKLVLDAFFHADYAAAVARCVAEDSALPEAERAELGLEHGLVGYELVKRWKFPLAIQQAIRDHHQPEREPAALTDLVHVANALCHALDIGNSGYEIVPTLSSGVWTRLGLGWEKMPALMAEIELQYVGMQLLVKE
ncbi:MAG: HDOD domain-containing protein, partial [Sulfuricella sp.]